MEEIFGSGGLIARAHPDYEYRPGQVEMAVEPLLLLGKGCRVPVAVKPRLSDGDHPGLSGQ